MKQQTITVEVTGTAQFAVSELSDLLAGFIGGFMVRDLRNEGYEAEQRRNKIAWWKRIAAKTGWPQTGIYLVMRDSDFDAGEDDMILKHETGVEIPFRIDDGESTEYISMFFEEVFPKATVIGDNGNG
jgi:hypothetical protein